MSPHAPKWNALHALDQRRLSSEGERRLRAHLGRCRVCTRALAAMGAYADATREVRRGEVRLAPDAWDRLAHGLAREGLRVEEVQPPHPPGVARVRRDSSDPMDLANAYERISSEIRLTPAPAIPFDLADRVLERSARERRERRWLIAAVVAAAACVGLLTQLFDDPGRQPSIPAPAGALASVEPPSATPDELAALPDLTPTAALLEVYVRALSGAPRADASPLRLGARVNEGQRCETSAHESVHFSVGEGSGFALGAEGLVTLARTRTDGVLLSLERGALSSSVAHGLPYVVEAAPYTFEVRGTRFSVARNAQHAVSARVDEGSVAVLEGGALVTVLDAGEVWSSAGAAFAPEPRVWSPRAGVALHVPAPETSPFVRFEADDVAWDTHSDVVLTVREGASLRLTFFDARGRGRSVTTQPVSEGTTVETPVESPLVRGHLPASVLSSVVRGHRADLDFCVSRAVRMAGRALDDVTLRLTITPEGVVSDVQLLGESATLPLRACLNAKARAWRFPRPGGSLPVQAQMRLSISAGTGR